MINFLRIAGGQDRGFAGYYMNGAKITFGWGLVFASHALGLLHVFIHPANHTIAPQQPTSISIITATRSRKPPRMPHKRSTAPPCADYLPPNKTAPGPVCDRNAVPPRIALSLTLRIGLQRTANARHLVLPQRPRNQGHGIHESEPKRGNMLEFNNFRMVNVMNWSESLRSLTSLKDLKVPCSLFKFIVQVLFDCLL